MADIIDTLAGLDDAALMNKIGLNKQLTDARKGIAEMQALTGDARKEAVERTERMFQPHVYPTEFKYIAQDAERHAKMKACKNDKVAAMCDCSPNSLAPMEDDD